MIKGVKILLIPEKVLPEMEVICEAIKPKIKGFHPDHLKEAISIVACHIRKDNTSAPLKMTYLKKLVPQADRYIKGLIDLAIIERSGRFIPGEVSYRYSFTPQYYSKFKSLPLLNAKLIRRIELVHEDLRKEGAKTTWGRSEQIKYLKRLEIDRSYIEMLEKNFSEDVERYNNLIGSGTRIENGEIFYNVDNTSGRFHSNVTNLGKVIRPYLRVDGEPLVNIDIKNSQPYLSTLILTDPSKVSWMTTDPAFAMLLQTL